MKQGTSKSRNEKYSTPSSVWEMPQKIKNSSTCCISEKNGDILSQHKTNSSHPQYKDQTKKKQASRTC